ncbi:hypothetical protein OIU79_016584 [Salix purpurea]|uniref:Uncharacterized protein n=1 Tax=Salix purpurea TaxID=77065 RepID=A0A9Q0PEN0_SALPP|nr:hypothetical protein OIU79_016584 [Salix purpurea]
MFSIVSDHCCGRYLKYSIIFFGWRFARTSMITKSSPKAHSHIQTLEQDN